VLADLSLLLADVDHCKAVNDTHGHPVGDDVLRQVAARLRSAVRSDDIIGRVGGEEFAILLPGTPLDAAVEVVERARAAVGAITDPVRLTTSIGVASLPLLAANADDLLAAADRGPYRAKNSGRDRVVVADRATRPLAGRRSDDVAHRVRQILDERRLRSVFQPVVEIRSGRVVGYEVLARVAGSLRSFGVEWAQGWFFGRPGDLDTTWNVGRSATDAVPHPT
jgi:diguanylate cyclase (GGDEF)-like protein